MPIITTSGQKVGVFRTIGETAKNTFAQVTPKIAGVAVALLYPMYVVTRTAMDSVPYVADRAITHATFGYQNLETLAGDPESMTAMGISAGITGLTGLAIVLGYNFVNKFRQGGKRIVESSVGDSAQVFGAQESTRHLTEQVRSNREGIEARVEMAEDNADGDRRIAKIERRSSGATGR